MALRYSFKAGEIQMFLKSKNKLLVFVFASFLVQSACTKDEESMKEPVKQDTMSEETVNSQNSGAVTENFSPVYFDFDSAVVKDTESLMKISDTLKSSNAAVQVAGHTDNRG